MKFLQKLGKALMLPVACLPICGILMGANGDDYQDDYRYSAGLRYVF